MKEICQVLAPKMHRAAHQTENA